MNNVKREGKLSAKSKDGQRPVSRREVLVLLVLFLVLAVTAGIFYTTRQGGAEAVITVDGKEYGKYPLAVNKTITIDGENGSRNVVEISSGEVFMKSASCPNQICVRTGKISKEGQSIVCLPNKVTVTISGGESGDIDSMSQ